VGSSRPKRRQWLAEAGGSDVLPAPRTALSAQTRGPYSERPCSCCCEKHPCFIKLPGGHTHPPGAAAYVREGRRAKKLARFHAFAKAAAPKPARFHTFAKAAATSLRVCSTCSCSSSCLQTSSPPSWPRLARAFWPVSSRQRTWRELSTPSWQTRSCPSLVSRPAQSLLQRLVPPSSSRSDRSVPYRARALR
jgi:hypothetical protein